MNRTALYILSASQVAFPTLKLASLRFQCCGGSLNRLKLSQGKTRHDPGSRWRVQCRHRCFRENFIDGDVLYLQGGRIRYFSMLQSRVFSFDLRSFCVEMARLKLCFRCAGNVGIKLS